MGKERRSMSGLFKRYGIWRIDKAIDGHRVQESTGTSDREEAERYLIHKLEQIRLAKVYGIRPKRIFREAAIKYLKENQHKRSILNDIWVLNTLDPYIGDLSLEAVHMGSLQTYIRDRQKASIRRENGVKSRTVNAGLERVRHILNLAASEWLDENGLTWLQSAPKIKLLDKSKDARKAYPLSWEEQDKLFAELSPELRRMALFAVNTGCRDREICRLRWEWELPVPELNTSVFIIPAEIVKNKDDRLVILNDNAKTIIEAARGIHPTYVFTYNGKPYYRMSSTSWRKGRKRAGLSHVRVHDLKHTFGRRLRAAGVNEEDRADLLGHKTRRITTHYSAAEIRNLLAAANKVCQRAGNTPILTILRNTRAYATPAKVAQLVKEIDLSTVAVNKAQEKSCETPAQPLQV